MKEALKAPFESMLLKKWARIRSCGRLEVGEACKLRHFFDHRTALRKSTTENTRSERCSFRTSEWRTGEESFDLLPTYHNFEFHPGFLTTWSASTSSDFLASLPFRTSSPLAHRAKSSHYPPLKTHKTPSETRFNYPWITLFVSIHIIHAYI